MAANKIDNRPLELLEESLQVLRTGGAPLLTIFWTGTLPFAISVLWMLRDTGFRWAGPFLLRDSLFCAVAFLWMSYWKSLASHKAMLLLSPPTSINLNWTKRLALQCIFQTIKLFAMPLAMASLIGWPAASSFFRTLALEPRTDQTGLRLGFHNAFNAASNRFSENAVSFLATAALALIIFFNVLITLRLLPIIWRIISGYETDWSRLENGSVLFSLTSIATVTTWFIIDPWLQTYTVLRIFYRNARSDGRDLLRELSSVAAVVLVGFVLAFTPAKAEPAVIPHQPDSLTDLQAMDKAIQKASAGVEYSWLRPTTQKAPDGFLGAVAKSISEAYVSARDHVKAWTRSFGYWLRDLLNNRTPAVSNPKKSKPHSQQLRWTLALLALLICATIIASFLRRNRYRPLVAANSAAAEIAADVLNENILPNEVKQEEWLRLASEYLAGNQTRLAARAFYLANLSYLGRQDLLALSLWKSNRLYERELARHPRGSNLSVPFHSTNRLYEMAWYGSRELAIDQVELIRGAVDQLRHNA